jgi:hypothetical protein
VVNDGMMRVKRSDKAVCRIIDDEVVILIPEKGILYALGGCGSRVWELIDGTATVSEIINIICDEYEVEPERAREDINEFIKDLTKLDLVELITEASEEINR